MPILQHRQLDELHGGVAAPPGHHLVDHVAVVIRFGAVRRDQPKHREAHDGGTGPAHPRHRPLLGAARRHSGAVHGYGRSISSARAPSILSRAVSTSCCVTSARASLEQGDRVRMQVGALQHGDRIAEVLRGQIEEPSQHPRLVREQDALLLVHHLAGAADVLQRIDHAKKRGHLSDLNRSEIDRAPDAPDARRVVEFGAGVERHGVFDGRHAVVVKERGSVGRFDEGRRIELAVAKAARRARARALPGAAVGGIGRSGGRGGWARNASTPVSKSALPREPAPKSAVAPRSYDTGCNAPPRRPERSPGRCAPRPL